ncbi:MAG: hypothetical protein LBB23_01950 [Rickettsiales bacterium]|jgi:hypothetical protein|nr:hypothetical protein [Rickettsiales bacterium]
MDKKIRDYKVMEKIIERIKSYGLETPAAMDSYMSHLVLARASAETAMTAGGLYNAYLQGKINEFNLELARCS